MKYYEALIENVIQRIPHSRDRMVVGFITYLSPLPL